MARDVVQLARRIGLESVRVMDRQDDPASVNSEWKRLVEAETHLEEAEPEQELDHDNAEPPHADDYVLVAALFSRAVGRATT